MANSLTAATTPASAAATSITPAIAATVPSTVTSIVCAEKANSDHASCSICRTTADVFRIEYLIFFIDGIEGVIIAARYMQDAVECKQKWDLTGTSRVNGFLLASLVPSMF